MKIVNSISGYGSLSRNTKNKKEANEISDLKKENKEVIYEKSQQIGDKNIKFNYSHLKSTKYAVDESEIERMKMELDERMKNSFIQMAKEVIGRQYITYKDSLKSILRDKKDKIKPEMIEQAKIDVSEGGHWSASNTADRLLEFAKTLSGGDPEKIDKLKEGFLKGFEEAEKAWGGALPEICQKTKDAVLEGFDDWKNEKNN